MPLQAEFLPGLPCLEPGAQHGKFRIVAELGRGGMGAVFLAEDTALARLVALKVLAGLSNAGARVQQRFMAEARSCAQLKHPNIVYLHAFEVLDGVPVIEMEYVEGGPLSRHVREAFVSPYELVQYAHDVAGALAYCHSRGAIHRDVKPSNILLDGQGRAKLADFGLAKIFATLEDDALLNSVSGVFKGTPHYAPPEAWDSGPPTPAWDLYSLGAVMYEVLAGVPPYQGNTPLELAKKIAAGSPRPLTQENPKISPALASLVDEMVRTLPEERPAGMVEVLRRLEALPEFVQAGEQTITRTLPGLRDAFPRARPAGWRRRMGSALLLFMVLFLAFVLGAYVDGRLRDLQGPRQITVTPAPQQDPAAFGRTLGIPELLSMSRGILGGNTARFTANLLETPGEQEAWLVAFSRTGAPAQLLFQGTHRLGWAKLLPTEGADRFRVAGHWAGFLDQQGTVLRLGTVEGTLFAAASSRIMSGALSLHAEQDGSTEVVTVTALAAETTDTQFLYTMEHSDYLQPLLYEELLPRKLGWPQEVLNLLPAIQQPDAGIFQTGNDTLAVDARFEEAFWTAGTLLPVQGHPAAAEAKCYLFLSGENLVIAWQFQALGPPEPTLMEINLVHRYAIPLAQSPRLGVRLDLVSGALHAVYAPPGQALQRVDYPAAMLKEGTAYQGEISLPLSLMKANAAAVHSGDVWRLTGRVLAGPDNQVLCWWGFPALESVQHGAVVKVRGE